MFVTDDDDGPPALAREARAVLISLKDFTVEVLNPFTLLKSPMLR